MLILKVKPEPPDAAAVMLPLVAPGALGFDVVAVTLTVTPEQGLGGGVLPPPFPQEKPVKINTRKKMAGEL